MLNSLRSKIQGRRGEQKVQAVLCSLGAEYHVFNDFIIPTKNGSTTQIDHCVVSKYGIFVIETKSHKGVAIYGYENANEWKEYFANGSYRSFHNPMRQNYGHIEALKDVLRLHDNVAYVPIICFSSNPKITVSTNKVVVPLNALKNSILAFQSRVLRDEDVQKVCNIIRERSFVDKASKQAHTENLKKNRAATEILEAEGICPKCGSKLVTRVGKYDEFIACSNYPTCRYRKPIQKQKKTYAGARPKRAKRTAFKKKLVTFLAICGAIFILLIIYEGIFNKTPSDKAGKPAGKANPSVTEAEQEELKEAVVTYHKYADEPNTLVINNTSKFPCHIELMDETGLIVLKLDVPSGVSEVKMPVGTWSAVLTFEGEEPVNYDGVIFSAWDATEPVEIRIG